MVGISCENVWVEDNNLIAVFMILNKPTIKKIIKFIKNHKYININWVIKKMNFFCSAIIKILGVVYFIVILLSRK